MKLSLSVVILANLLFGLLANKNAAGINQFDETEPLDTTSSATVDTSAVTEINKPINNKCSDEEDTLPDDWSIEDNITAINIGYEQLNTHYAIINGEESFYPLTDEERSAIETIVASEGGYCGYEFQALVAECVLNGCLAEDMRPLEIFARGDFWLTNNVAPDEVTKQAVADVFDKGILPTEEKIRYYYNPSFCESELHEQCRYVLTNCGCRFFTDW